MQFTAALVNVVTLLAVATVQANAGAIQAVSPLRHLSRY